MYRCTVPPAPSSGPLETGSVRPAAGLRGLPLAGRGVAVEIAIGLSFGEPPVQDVLDVLHDEVDGHCRDTRAGSAAARPATTRRYPRGTRFPPRGIHLPPSLSRQTSARWGWAW